MACLALALQEINLAGDEADCKKHGGCHHSPMHWEKMDSKLWANSINPRPTTASSECRHHSPMHWEKMDSKLGANSISSRPTTASSDCCQLSRPWTPASSSTVTSRPGTASSSTASSRPRTATSAQSVVEDARALAEAARAEADAAMAAAVALDVLPAALPTETSNITDGTRDIGNLQRTCAHDCPAGIIMLGPVPPALTAVAVSEFLGSLTQSRASFDKLDWTPKVPIVEKPLDSNCALGGAAYSGNSFGSRSPLQRVNVAQFEQRPQELVVGAGSARASKIPHKNRLDSQTKDISTATLESGASPPSRKVSRASTRRRSISCSSSTNELGTGNSAESSNRRLHRTSDITCNSEKALLPHIQSGVTTPTAERPALLDNVCRRNDADFRPQQRRGLLMRTAMRVEGPRGAAAAVLPPLPLDATGRSRSAASLHQQTSCCGGSSRLQRSQSLASSSLLPRALTRGASSSRLSSHRDPVAASRGRVQIDHVRTQL